jgi:hypothetical protein
MDQPSGAGIAILRLMSFLVRALIVIGVIYWLSPIGGDARFADLTRPVGEKAVSEAMAWCRDKPAECVALTQKGQEALARGLKPSHTQ